MLCEVPLTKEQQDFAAEHHGLVYKFLNDNHLPENEFYDVVIFPYLKAVKDYFSDESAQHYSFAAIAMHRMRLCIYDYSTVVLFFARKKNDWQGQPRPPKLKGMGWPAVVGLHSRSVRVPLGYCHTELLQSPSRHRMLSYD